MEGFSEPLFFCWPAADEFETAKIAGRWDCSATREDGSRPRLAWELAVEGDQLAGRMDQNTDYRFAFIRGGSFRSNQIELRIEYIQETFVLTGAWRQGKLEGDWWRDDGGEVGTWKASPSFEPAILPANHVRALFEWRRATDGAACYRVEGETPGPGWEKSARPLGRVWIGAEK